MKKPTCLADFPRTPPEVLSRLYEQLQLIHDVCDREGIVYVLNGGSLLGFVRNGGIIPHDDDADIFLHEKDGPRLFTPLREAAETCGMVLVNSEHGMKLKCGARKGVGTDIFYYRARDNNPSMLELAKDISRKTWPKDWFYAEEIATRKLGKFGPIYCYIPSNPTRYLFQVYGERCFREAKLDFNHLENRRHEWHNVVVPL